MIFHNLYFVDTMNSDTELQDLSGMEEVYRQQKDKLVSQSVLGINPPHLHKELRHTLHGNL